MVVGDSQDAAGPQAVRKAEISVGEVGQARAHEVDEALPPDGRDLRTQHSSARLGFRAGPIPTLVSGHEMGLGTRPTEGLLRFIKQSTTLDQIPTRACLTPAAQLDAPLRAWEKIQRYLVTKRMNRKPGSLAGLRVS